MSYSRSVLVENGDILCREYYFSCDHCSEEIFEGDPHYEDCNIYHLCWDCAFIKGVITEELFLRHSPFHLPNMHAAVQEGKIIYWQGTKSALCNSRNRNTLRYQIWRKAVFERDKYTCQSCGQTGGELNAHHIKLWSKYPKQRYVLSNGLTLCKNCHKTEHRKRVM